MIVQVPIVLSTKRPFAIGSKSLSKNYLIIAHLTGLKGSVTLPLTVVYQHHVENSLKAIF